MRAHDPQTAADWQRLIDESAKHCDDLDDRLEWIGEQTGMETQGFILDWSGDSVGYVNVGNPYEVTVCLHEGSLSVACYADYIEADEQAAAEAGFYRSAYSGEFFNPSEYWAEMSQSDRIAILRKGSRWRAFSFAHLRGLVGGESCNGIRLSDILDHESSR